MNYYYIDVTCKGALLVANWTSVAEKGIEGDNNLRAGAVLQETTSTRFTFRSAARLIRKIRLKDNAQLNKGVDRKLFPSIEVSDCIHCQIPSSMDVRQ